MADTPIPTNTAGTEEQFDRTYTDYNPQSAQGPQTEILATILNPEGS